MPELSAFGGQLAGTPGREISTTMAFVRILNTLLRDKAIGKHVVPIVPDESRTFGMEGMFRQFGIFSQAGQLYQPEDANQLMYYREAPDGQMLQEGINEAGAMASWIAAATAYSTSDMPMIPFYIFYSMFGFQRVMDLIWAAGDSRARGFLLGGTAGRTTLNGEGLQHEDGHSHVLASVVPNCVSYDPTYSYEVAVIIQDGLRRMLAEQEDVFFYITLMNENYEHPALPEGAEAGILRGMYLLRPGSGAAGVPWCSCSAAAPSCGRCWPAPTCWPPTTASPPTCGARRASPSCGATGSPPSGGTCCTRPSAPRRSYVEDCLAGRSGPVIAATDYVKSFADQIRALRAAALPGAGDRRLRPFGLPAQPAPLLRGRPALRRRRRAGLAGRGRDDPGGHGRRRDLAVRHRSRTSRNRREYEPPAPGKRSGSPQGEQPCPLPLKSAFPTSATSPTCRSSRSTSQPGDVVSDEDPLITLESDKATMDIPSPAAGTVRELRVKVGDLVSRGSPILLLDTAAAPTEPPPLTDQQEPPAQAAPLTRWPRRRSLRRRSAARGGPGGAGRQPRSRPAPVTAGASAGPPADFDGVHAGPGVRRLARELGLDLAALSGTGPKGRITKEDVIAGVRGPASPRPAAGRARAAASRRSRPRTSRSSARSRSGRCRASSGCPGPRCTGPGSTSRTSPTTTRPTSPTWTPTAGNSTPPPRPRATG